MGWRREKSARSDEIYCSLLVVEENRMALLPIQCCLRLFALRALSLSIYFTLVS